MMVHCMIPAKINASILIAPFAIPEQSHSSHLNPVHPFHKQRPPDAVSRPSRSYLTQNILEHQPVHTVLGCMKHDKLAHGLAQSLTGYAVCCSQSVHCPWNLHNRPAKQSQIQIALSGAASRRCHTTSAGKQHCPPQL